MKSADLQLDAVVAAVNALPAGSLSAARQAALEQLRAAGMPKSREEDWKYTDVSTLVDITNAWLADGAAVPRPGDVERIQPRTCAVSRCIEVAARERLRS